MHVVRLAAPVAALMFVAFLSTASAQGASATVALTAPASTDVALGGTATVPITVQLTIQNIICAPGQGTASVTMAVNDPNPMAGITSAMPTTVVFAIPGPMAYPQTGPWTDSQTVNMNVTVAGTTLANHEHTFNVTATLTPSGLGGCTAAPPGTVDASDSAATIIKTGAGGSTGTGGNNTGSASGTNTLGSTSEASVSLPLAIQVCLLLAMGIFVARRK